MNKVQNSKLQAWILLRILCTANNLIWQVIAAFVTAFGLFSTRLDTLIENARIQEELVNGYARQKQQSKLNMSRLSNSIRSKTQAYADTLDNGKVLYDQVNYSFSKLMIMSAPNALSACNTILKRAQEHATDIQPFGVLATDITLLAHYTADFTQAMVMPRQAIAQVKGLTEQIKKDTAYIDNIINKRLSKLMINFQDSSPKFFADFFNCARPVHGPTSFTEFDIVTKSNGVPINGVSVTAIGATKTYSGKTQADGQLPLKKISPELYDLVFEIPGYHPLQLNGQKAVLGAHTQIIAELVPMS